MANERGSTRSPGGGRKDSRSGESVPVGSPAGPPGPDGGLAASVTTASENGRVPAHASEVVRESGTAGAHRSSRPWRSLRSRPALVATACVLLLVVVAAVVVIRFRLGGTTTGASAAATCRGAANTAGGKDPWGGCWPAAWNAGYPHGLPGDTRTPVTLTPYTGPCDVRVDHAVIDSKLVDCHGMLIYARDVTIRNSKINGLVNTNSPRASVTLVDTEVDGLAVKSQAIGMTNVTLLRVDVHNNQHGVHCYGGCSVRDSYIHDQNPDGLSLGWHQNGFISNGGANMQLTHSTIGCRGGCTSPVTLITDADISHVVIDHNLVLASTDSPYCINAGSNRPAKPGSIDHIVVTDNVFQRGPDGKCGVYGVIGGWDGASASNGNVWRGNTMDDGAPLEPS